MRRKPTAIIFRRELGKSPIFQPIEIASQFCLTADFSGINHQDERPARGPGRGFHNPAPAAAAIPDWPASPGLCSSRATEALWQKRPVTNPSSCATFAPAGRSNSLGCPSRPATVTRARRKSVFTQTQMTQKCHIFCACNLGANFARIDMLEGKAAALIGSMRPCQRETFARRPHRSPLNHLQLSELIVKLLEPHHLCRAIHPNISRS